MESESIDTSYLGERVQESSQDERDYNVDYNEIEQNYNTSLTESIQMSMDKSNKVSPSRSGDGLYDKHGDNALNDDLQSGYEVSKAAQNVSIQDGKSISDAQIYALTPDCCSRSIIMDEGWQIKKISTSSTALSALILEFSKIIDILTPVRYILFSIDKSVNVIGDAIKEIVRSD